MPIEIPYKTISNEALTGIAEEYVNREGTDYGNIEYSFQSKVSQIIEAIKSGKAKIIFDPESQSLNLVEKECPVN